MKRTISTFLVGLMSVQAVSAAVPQDASAFVKRLKKVVKKVGGKGGLVDRTGRGLDKESRSLDRSIRRNWLDQCRKNPEECEERKVAKRSERASGNTRSHMAILEVDCIDRNTGRESGDTVLRVSSKRSVSAAESDALAQMRSRNVCTDGGYGYRSEKGVWRWKHR